MKYIPLNVKTHYELLNSLIKINDLVSYAVNNNISSVGITDSNMFSCMEFYYKCISNNIKPIIGVDLDALGLYVYAKNYDGYVSLCNIVSKKNLDSISINDIVKHSNNIIVVTSYDKYDEFKGLFDDIYVSYDNELNKTNALVLTKNVVYLPKILCLNESDNEYLTYLNLIKQKKTILDEKNVYNNHFIDNSNDFDIKTTIIFASKINIEFPKTKLHIPVFREDASKYILALSRKGLEKRLDGKVTTKYKDRLLYELSVIENMGFVNYFLIVYDFVLYAKKKGIMVGPGRGSAAGSLVSYALGITDIDPLKYGLIFERFLNPDRITMPDIDIDFDNVRRNEVVEYVKNKYGEYCVGNIISFDTLLPKQALIDLGKVLNIDSVKVEGLTKTINNETDFQELRNNKSFISIVKRDNEIKELTRIANKICGLKKNTSMHAAGVVISDIELSDIMPLYKRDNTILTGYSMEYIEGLGLLKMDFLAIKNLNTIFNIIHEINKSESFDINKIDLNDEKTLSLFKDVNTSGIFQFESSGMKSFLRQLKVDSFNTLVDAIALYRPGPRDMIPTYIKRKEGKERISYLIKELEPILSSTYGVMIYQEQVLEILRSTCGYTYAEADIIRRAMSKKKLSVIENERNKFINSIISLGYSNEIANELFEQIIKFSNYGFNKSHSVVYSVVAFQMAYLKVHYPLYFMNHLLNMNKSSDKIMEYINESKLYKIEFEDISINKSQKEFVISNNKIIMPLSIIKNIAGSVSDEIIIERNKGEFKNFYDFMIRCYKGSVNKRIVISLIECGAFNNFNLNKRETIENFNTILNYVSLCKDIDESLVEKPILDSYSDYTSSENIENEIFNIGFYLSGHPVTSYDRSKHVKLCDINKFFNKTVKTILLVDSIKSITTKNNEKMSFVKLSDEFGSIEGVIFPKTLLKVLIEKGKVYELLVSVEKRNDQLQLIIINKEEI